MKKKIDALRELMAANEWQKAIALAVRFPRLENKAVIERAHMAYTNPRFLVQLRRDVEECKQLGINYKKIAREAKKRGYVKGDLSGLTQELARVKSEIVQLPVQQQDTLSKEVDRIMEAKDFYATNARKVAKAALSGLAQDVSPMNAKTTMEVLHKGLVVEGVVPYYPNAQTINNTNAQQENKRQITYQVIDAKPKPNAPAS